MPERIEQYRHDARDGRDAGRAPRRQRTQYLQNVAEMEPLVLLPNHGFRQEGLQGGKDARQSARTLDNTSEEGVLWGAQLEDHDLPRPGGACCLVCIPARTNQQRAFAERGHVALASRDDD